MTAEERLEAELTELSEEVRRLIEHAEAGQPVDVTGLDGTLRGLCDRACGAAVERRDQIMAGLAQLERDLGRLAEAIERQLHQTGGTTAPGRAAAAYGRSRDG